MEKGNKELIEALNLLEKEKSISKEVLFEALETSLMSACKSQYGKNDNIRVVINRETGAVAVYADMTVVEEVVTPALEMSIVTANEKFPGKKYEVGDVVSVEVTPKNFGRIAAGQAKQTVVQKIREEERKILFEQYSVLENTVVSGIVQRFFGNNISINIGKVDGILIDGEQIKGERFKHGDRVKVFVVDVKDHNKGPKITLSRTHPELVKKLFEMEVTEIENGTVEIMALSRDAGARTKMAVRSNEAGVDPIGACVGPNGMRVNAVVDELGGEKIDIIAWSDNPEILIKNALSPAKAISVSVNVAEKSANVVVPDSQLSLAIGREGQNARLAARLTGYKIDIKSESQISEM
ncbi:MAG: transcription termination factor NusA [Clostridiales bacterium]|nr:transcription termination factor NusA [Clostridiales bacterium]